MNNLFYLVPAAAVIFTNIGILLYYNHFIFVDYTTFLLPSVNGFHFPTIHYPFSQKSAMIKITIHTERKFSHECTMYWPKRL